MLHLAGNFSVIASEDPSKDVIKAIGSYPLLCGITGISLTFPLSSLSLLSLFSPVWAHWPAERRENSVSAAIGRNPMESYGEPLFQREFCMGREGKELVVFL